MVRPIALGLILSGCSSPPKPMSPETAIPETRTLTYLFDKDLKDNK